MHGWYYEDYGWLPQIPRVALSFKIINRITFINPGKREVEKLIVIQLRY